MDFGYARVSKDEQNLHLQLDALVAKGIDRRNIFVDKMTGTKWVRKGLDDVLKTLQQGDRLFVWKLDRLGRSSVEIIQTVMKIQAAGVQFISLTENIDTSTPMGEFFFKLMAILAELERNIIVQRTKAGLDAARARGRKGGRPKLAATASKVALAKRLYYEEKDGKRVHEIHDICHDLHISRPTLYRYIHMES